MHMCGFTWPGTVPQVAWVSMERDLIAQLAVCSEDASKESSRYAKHSRNK